MSRARSAMQEKKSRAVVCWVAFYLGVHCISLRCSTERNLSGRLVSLAAWQFLLFHRFVPE